MSITIINVGDLPNSMNKIEYMLDSEEELNDLPTDIAPGSFASLVDCTAGWRLDAHGEWVKIGGDD